MRIDPLHFGASANSLQNLIIFSTVRIGPDRAISVFLEVLTWYLMDINDLNQLYRPKIALGFAVGSIANANK
jgi:hypothetical protein